LPGAPQSGAAAQVIALHAVQSPDGQISDVEVLASSESSLNPAALAFASKWQGGTMGESQSGATPQSHEVVMMVEYVGSTNP
jgi:hypothetical protein